MEKLSRLVAASKDAHINAMVLDVHTSRYDTCQVPRENVEFCIKNGIHPIARIVVFPDGLKRFPVPEAELQARIALAEKACKNGFREIQFDYIRFNDHGTLRHLTLQQKYDFIEGFLARARAHVKKYDAKISADIFGRIPLNNNDSIGQRMEGLDKVVDIICPMAYPSHYTWCQKLMADPYHTVFLTSKRAKERVKNAEIVTYIQTFKMKLGASGMSYDKYIEEQIRAVHDAGIKGYLMWNARQDYIVPLQVVKNYYLASPKMITVAEDKNEGERRSFD
ncbi:MAG TPA: putative glycoside hydrolase [Spirochaetota bacterium]|nr:putative glycoside hydrolase [Spirochaetota bacterium]